MDSAVIKFIEYCEKLQYNMEAILVSNLGREDFSSLDEIYANYGYINDIIKFLSISRAEWKSCNSIFLSLGELSILLKESPLNNRESMKVLFAIIEKNLATGIIWRKGTKDFDMSVVNKYDFRFMTKDNFLDMYRSGEYLKLFNKKTSEMTEEERGYYIDIKRIFNRFPSTSEKLINLYKEINDCYFSKKDSYDEEDVLSLSKLLKELDIPNDYCLYIQNYLLRKLESSKKKDNDKIGEYLKKEEDKETNRLSWKEQKFLMYELNKYYLPLEKECVKYLSEEEIINVIVIMKKLGTSDKEIRDFLRLVGKSNKQYDTNPISEFVDIYLKFVYYSDNDNDNVRIHLDNILEILNNMMITCDEEYIDWKKMLADELEDCKKEIGFNGEYELESAKKVLKK